MCINSKQDIVKKILKLTKSNTNINSQATGRAFAPSNIALVKYWGKSNTELNIPYTDSLSISLGNLGAKTEVSMLNSDYISDQIYLNNKLVNPNTEFYKRIKLFLDLFRSNNRSYVVKTNINIPVAAGVASSACGFAALVLALNDLYQWRLDKITLSILARLGSGSAARSIYDESSRFVYWQKGTDSLGMDSYAYPINVNSSSDNNWSELQIGLILLSTEKKPISSREAMLRTVETSMLYQTGWANQVKQDLKLVQHALESENFKLLGETVENNALAMHATMLSARPAILYSTEDTISIVNKIWHLRKNGLPVYFTQDAGPNIKIIFQKNNLAEIIKEFPDVVIA